MAVVGHDTSVIPEVGSVVIAKVCYTQLLRYMLLLLFFRSYGCDGPPAFTHVPSFAKCGIACVDFPIFFYDL